MAKDYYKTLDVSRSATDAEIQKAYRDLARKYHPDLNPDDKQAREKFQEVQKAFETLNDPQKREMYDRYGSAYESMGAGGGPRPGGGGWSGAGGAGPEFDLGDLFGGGGGGFADIFKQFGGGGGAAGARTGAGRQAPPRRGIDLTHELQVPFNTAVTGGELQLTVERGGGRRETIAVKIPVGIASGKKIRLRGQGEAAPGGGPRGDILIRVQIAPHPHFRRTGKRLDVRVPVTLSEAALGAKIDVPTPRGTIALSVPPGTSSGTKLRIKGHGVAPAGDPPGDLYAEILIVLPDHLDDDDRKAIERIGEKQKGDVRKELRW